MGLTAICWAELSPPETVGLMERWEHQRAARVPWLAARLERAGLTLSFDPGGVSSVGKWCAEWFAAPDAVDDQPSVVWVERRSGARLPCTEDATVVADAVGGFVESVLWAEQGHARRIFAPRAVGAGRPQIGANEPGLGHVEPTDVALPWRLMQAIRGIALRGTRGRDLRRDLTREHTAARARLAADRDRSVQT